MQHCPTSERSNHTPHQLCWNSCCSAVAFFPFLLPGRFKINKVTVAKLQKLQSKDGSAKRFTNKGS